MFDQRLDYSFGVFLPLFDVERKHSDPCQTIHGGRPRRGVWDIGIHSDGLNQSKFPTDIGELSAHDGATSLLHIPGSLCGTTFEP